MRSTYHTSHGGQQIKTLKKTRKAFLIEYGCGSFLIFLLVIGPLHGVHLHPKINFLMGFMAFISFASAEYSRYMERYLFMDNKIVIVNGIIKQNRQNVYFHPLAFVPHLNVKQNRVQRLLGYGSVYLKGENRNAFEIKDINRPHRILQKIEESIESNRKVE